MSIRIRRRGSDAFTDRVETFSNAVKSGTERSKRLLGGPVADLEQDPDALRVALEELRVQHEELVVAEEELRAQLDELDRMGARLQSERERYVDLFETAPDAYLVTDRDGVIRDANAAGVTLLGVEMRFLRGKPMAAFLAPGQDRALREMLLQTMAGANEGGEGGVGSVGALSARLHELTIRPRGGEEVVVVANVTSTSRGQRFLWIIRPAIAAANPMSNNKSSVSDPDDAIRRALREKDELLDRERRAREELENANRAKDRFIAVLSHDLRAPLNAILGWTQLLRGEVLPSASRHRALETIERNAYAQANLIDALLDVSRMAADRVQLELAPIDVGAIVQRVVEGALPKSVELGLDLRFSIERDLTVIADRQRLEQVLTNLLMNAMKYTPASGRIDVEAKRDGVHVTLIVRDTGKGIRPALLPQIFEMYKQDGAYASARSGLGLGLYIVKRLVELQDGTVAVDSEGEGRGATFTVRLPFRADVLVRGGVAESEHAGIVAAAPPSLRGVRVLVVDDDDDSRELMGTILERAGAEARSAMNGKSALEIFETWPPDVVVSDLAMPGGDGFELIAALKQRDPSLTALAVSGFTSETDMARTQSAGFDAHIGKPIDATELIEVVLEAYQLRRG